MIEQFLAPVLENTGKTLAKGASSLVKAIGAHFAKHGSKYAVGGGLVAAAGTGAVINGAIEHEKGKKEGTAEQAARDAKKMEEMHKKHESDRQRWNKQRQQYEDLFGKDDN